MVNKNLEPREDGVVNGSRGVIIGFVDPSRGGSFKLAADPEKPRVDAIGGNGGGGEGAVSTVSDCTALDESHLPPMVMRDKRDLLPVIRLLDGRIRVIGTETFDYKAGKQTLASRTQIPLVIAYAISIHKMQGKMTPLHPTRTPTPMKNPSYTFSVAKSLWWLLIVGSKLDLGELDMSTIFGYAMAYTALSRFSSLYGMRLLNWNRHCIRASPACLQFYGIVISEPEPESAEEIKARKLKTRRAQEIFSDSDLDLGFAM